MKQHDTTICNCIDSYFLYDASLQFLPPPRISMKSFMGRLEFGLGWLRLGYY